MSDRGNRRFLWSTPSAPPDQQQVDVTDLPFLQQAWATPHTAPDEDSHADAPPAAPTMRRTTAAGAAAPGWAPAPAPSAPPLADTTTDPGGHTPWRQVDWALVRRIRAEAAERRDAQSIADPDVAREYARDVITQLVDDEARRAVASGDAILTSTDMRALAAAAMDSLYGLGRFQPLVDIPTVENVEIRGWDDVLLEHHDSVLQTGPPVADSDAELLETLQLMASQLGAQARPFNHGVPFLNLSLPGNIRLTATNWVTDRPRVWLRLHRLPRLSMSDAVDRSMVTESMAVFLSAAVKASMSIVVCGPQGAGKALALDTEVPTPGGWTTMGALNTGDQVFAEDGAPCTVLEAHDYQFGRTCYEVEFDDGTTVVADADHLWRVSTQSHRDSARRNRGNPLPEPTFCVSAEERARLWAYAGDVASSPDRQVTVAEFVGEVGDSHVDVVRQCAQRLTPRGHTYSHWTCRDGRRGGRPVLSYSRQELATALAVARDTPRPTKPRLPDSVVLTTQDIADSPLWAQYGSWRTYNFSIPLSAAVHYPATTQPIDPYVLGVWLGDGATAAARITTADAEVVNEIREAGYPCTPVKGTNIEFGVGGNLQVKLRLLSLLGDKHIPATYLRASIDQRVALLHGLMDSDGTCSKSGRCGYTTTLQVLGEQVHELVRSLGYKATLSTKPVRWKNDTVGTSWTVSWATRDPMFRLSRKRERQTHNGGGPVHRAIVGVRRVNSVPVRCITVDSPSSLFLITRSMIATHNTTFMRALAQEIPPEESIVTVEGERELFIDKIPAYTRVTSVETRPGTGELDPAGRPLGLVTADEAILQSLRMNANRIIVGEVRGPEITAMVKVMESGPGGMATTHAKTARHAVGRLATLIQEAQPATSYPVARRKLAEQLQLIVHLDKKTVTNPDGTTSRRRFVSEIIAVEPSETGDVAMTTIFGPDAGPLPPWLGWEVAEHGYDPRHHDGGTR